MQLKKGIVQFALRKAADFDKYKVLDMVQDLAINVKDKKADYFSSLFHPFRENRQASRTVQILCSCSFRNRDYEKIVEAVNKIDKSFAQDASAAPTSLLAYPPLRYVVQYTRSF